MRIQDISENPTSNNIVNGITTKFNTSDYGKSFWIYDSANIKTFGVSGGFAWYFYKKVPDEHSNYDIQHTDGNYYKLFSSSILLDSLNYWYPSSSSTPAMQINENNAGTYLIKISNGGGAEGIGVKGTLIEKFSEPLEITIVGDTGGGGGGGGPTSRWYNEAPAGAGNDVDWGLTVVSSVSSFIIILPDPTSAGTEWNVGDELFVYWNRTAHNLDSMSISFNIPEGSIAGSQLNYNSTTEEVSIIQAADIEPGLIIHNFLGNYDKSSYKGSLMRITYETILDDTTTTSTTHPNFYKDTNGNSVDDIQYVGYSLIFSFTNKTDNNDTTNLSNFKTFLSNFTYAYTGEDSSLLDSGGSLSGGIGIITPGGGDVVDKIALFNNYLVSTEVDSNDIGNYQGKTIPTGHFNKSFKITTDSNGSSVLQALNIDPYFNILTGANIEKNNDGPTVGHLNTFDRKFVIETYR